jgi:beta-lactamase class A
LGIHGFHLQDDEAALHHNVQLQYRNWFEPSAAVQLLHHISDPLLLTWMQQTTRGPSRIKGLLPAGTVVMHRPGSSDTDHGLTHAWNDIGLITLPDGRRLAIAVFITDSTAGEKNRDRIIAQIARAAYDKATHANQRVDSR